MVRCWAPESCGRSSLRNSSVWEVNGGIIPAKPSWKHCGRAAAVRVCVIFTAELKVTVVDCHVPEDLHVAPGALWVSVGVPTLVTQKADFGDELLVFAEGLRFR